MPLAGPWPQAGGEHVGRDCFADGIVASGDGKGRVVRCQDASGPDVVPGVPDPHPAACMLGLDPREIFGG